jgi:ABC-2 type transport system ATP-binding protein
VSDKEATVVLERVTKRFDGFTAVSELDLRVGPGRIFGLLGPNGAGKTTTLRMIVGIIAPDEGRIELFGEHISERTRERVGYLPEERGLYKRMKVGEQLRFFGELKGLSARSADPLIDRWLEKVKLSEWKNKKVSELSKGMQQKVQFIAAVLHDPDLLILDEPSSGLDPVNAELLKEIVLELKSAGKSIIFSTHQMALAEDVCDDICLINRARKVLDGSLREVKRGLGRNAVALRFEGDGAVLSDAKIVAGVRDRGDFQEIMLADGAVPQDLLEKLVAARAQVSKFELVEPSLHDIFIAQVGGDGE